MNLEQLIKHPTRITATTKSLLDVILVSCPQSVRGSGVSTTLSVNSILSDPLPITHGVPQGAILSPLLFCIYLNDLPCAPQVCGLESYVDDSKVFLSFSLPDVDTAIANLEQDLLRVAAWCCENQLVINPDKTKFTLIATK